MTGCYVTSLPLEFMRATADFEPEWAGSYFVPRATVIPPASLQKRVWPALDDWTTKYQDATANSMEESIATGAFFELLDWLRRVFLQDSVFYKEQYPEHPIFQDPLFQTAEYQTFARQVRDACAKAHEDSHALAIEKSVPAIAEKLRLVCNGQEALQKALRTHTLEQSNQIAELTREVQELRQGFSISLTVSPGGTRTTRYEPEGEGEDQARAQSRARARARARASPRREAARETRPMSQPRRRAMPTISSPTATISAMTVARPPAGRPSDNPAVALAAASRAAETPVVIEQPPSYALPRNTHSVLELLHIWRRGTIAMPSVDTLEGKWGHRWRPRSDRVYFCNRKSIISEVENRAAIRNLDEEVVARQMDVERGSDSLDKFMKKLKVQKKVLLDIE